jgi:hypothetical protein
MTVTDIKHNTKQAGKKENLIPTFILLIAVSILIRNA